MPEKLSPADTATIACAVIGMVLYLGGTFIDSAGFRALGIVLMGVGVALMLYDNYKRDKKEKLTLQNRGRRE